MMPERPQPSEDIPSSRPWWPILGGAGPGNSVPDILVLGALGAGDLHGAEMRKAIADSRSVDGDEVQRATIEMNRLHEAGLITDLGRAAISEILSIVDTDKRPNKRVLEKIDELLDRLVDDGKDPVAIAISSIAKDSLRSGLESDSPQASVAGADVGGALGGAGIGWKVGGMLGGNVVLGAVIGAVAGGAISSFAEWA